MRDAACTAVPHLCAGAAPGLRTLNLGRWQEFLMWPLCHLGQALLGWRLHSWRGLVSGTPHKGGAELGILGHESAYTLLCARHWVSQAPGCIPQWHCGLGRSLSDGNHCSGRHHLLVCKNIWWQMMASRNAETFVFHSMGMLYCCLFKSGCLCCSQSIWYQAKQSGFEGQMKHEAAWFGSHAVCFVSTLLICGSCLSSLYCFG